jgi:hypothetical protein
MNILFTPAFCLRIGSLLHRSQLIWFKMSILEYVLNGREKQRRRCNNEAIGMFQPIQSLLSYVVHTSHLFSRNSPAYTTSKPVDVLIEHLNLAGPATQSVFCAHPPSRTSYAWNLAHLAAMGAQHDPLTPSPQRTATHPRKKKQKTLDGTSSKPSFSGPSEQTRRGWRCPYLLLLRRVTTEFIADQKGVAGAGRVYREGAAEYGACMHNNYLRGNCESSVSCDVYHEPASCSRK